VNKGKKMKKTLAAALALVMGCALQSKEYRLGRDALVNDENSMRICNVLSCFISFQKDQSGLIFTDLFKKPITGTVTKYHFEGLRSENLQLEYPCVDGKLHGSAKIYYEWGGKLQETAVFKNGVKDGIHKLYYDKGWHYHEKDGTLREEIPYKDGVIHGTRKVYYKSGYLEQKTPYVEGKRNGLEKNYYDGFMRFISSETFYKDDRIEGVQKIYRYQLFGKREFEIPYKDGKKEGMSIGYHLNGKVEYEIPYKDGKQEGVEREYYEDGKIKREIPYKNGEKDGVEKYYAENGAVTGVFPYESGKRVGEHKSYYDDGKLQYTLNYIDGKEEGVEESYYHNGNLKSVKVFKSGKEIGVSKEYYENGNLKEEIQKGLKKWVEKLYYENGNLKEETSYDSGHKDGVNKRYHEDGKIKLEALYKKYKSDYKYKDYYYSAREWQKHYLENGAVIEITYNSSDEPVGGACLGADGVRTPFTGDDIYTIKYKGIEALEVGDCKGMKK
jgi:antitoxin component YwqK of YwqJK toxin-antitoxin module